MMATGIRPPGYTDVNFREACHELMDFFTHDDKSVMSALQTSKYILQDLITTYIEGHETGKLKISGYTSKFTFTRMMPTTFHHYLDAVSSAGVDWQNCARMRIYGSFPWTAALDLRSDECFVTAEQELSQSDSSSHWN